MPMKILIDGDGCPVVGITIDLSRKYKISCIILCDTSHQIDYEGVQTVIVPKGADNVDFKLVNMLQPGDIVVTQDYGLAAMCLSRRGIPIRQDGMVYNQDNIDFLLQARYSLKKMRDSGTRIKGNSKRTKEEDMKFKSALETLITGLLRYLTYIADRSFA